jgi:hypothetical protein
MVERRKIIGLSCGGVNGNSEILLTPFYPVGQSSSEFLEGGMGLNVHDTLYIVS